jgi:alpha-L-fucosidase
MKGRFRFCLLSAVLYLLFVDQAKAQEPNKLEWFRDAQLGIFIHWGIYSVNGVDESWSFHNRKIS